MEKEFTVGAIVVNRFGVLNRVSALFSKRRYNIKSLAVGEIDNPNFSRITIVVTGDDYVKEQVVKQLNKLQDVHRVELLNNDMATSREHMLIKLKSTPENANKITTLTNGFAGKIVSFSDDTVTIEITGDQGTTDEVIERAKEIGIIEVCRAGVVALAR